MKDRVPARAIKTLRDRDKDPEKLKDATKSTKLTLEVDTNPAKLKIAEVKVFLIDFVIAPVNERVAVSAFTMRVVWVSELEKSRDAVKKAANAVDPEINRADAEPMKDRTASERRLDVDFVIDPVNASVAVRARGILTLIEPADDNVAVNSLLVLLDTLPINDNEPDSALEGTFAMAPMNNSDPDNALVPVLAQEPIKDIAAASKCDVCLT